MYLCSLLEFLSLKRSLRGLTIYINKWDVDHVQRVAAARQVVAKVTALALQEDAVN